jgi:hypothetical protein
LFTTEEVQRQKIELFFLFQINRSEC